MTPPFARFVLPDGRSVSVMPDAVTAVYEREDGTTVIAISQTNLVVPYTHDEVMALLWPS